MLLAVSGGLFPTQWLIVNIQTNTRVAEKELTAHIEVQTKQQTLRDGDRWEVGRRKGTISNITGYEEHQKIISNNLISLLSISHKEIHKEGR